MKPKQPELGPVNIPVYPNLAPRAHIVTAIAKKEWDKRGIWFKSCAEQGKFGAWKANDDGSEGQISRGASILDDLMR